MTSPVVSVSMDDFAKTAPTTLSDVLKFIPQNIGTTGGANDNAKGGGSDARRIRSFNLRGLGAGATMVLPNGQRVVPSEGFVNLNSLTPEIAICRIETILDGASATYGADAGAGVFNVITNKNFDGFRASAEFKGIADSPEGNVQLMRGV